MDRSSLNAPITPTPPVPDELMHATYYRLIDDGWEITVLRMAYSWRLCLGRVEARYCYEKGYCYSDLHVCIAAAATWDGQGDPPVGWHRDINTGRRRADGDPARETINP